MAALLRTGAYLDSCRAAGMDPDALGAAFGLLEGWVEEGTLPGAAALVQRGGRIAGEAYFGSTARDGRRVDSDTLWGLASITKTFTATALMLLVERGALCLDEPLTGLLPELAEQPEPEGPPDARRDAQAVTARHLLSHCSGLPGFSRDNLELRKHRRPLEDFVTSFLREPLLFEPGSLHLYSSVGIGLVAEVVGRAITGTLGAKPPSPMASCLGPFLDSELLAPLGMDRTSLCPPEAWYEEIAFIEGTERQDPGWGVNSPYFRRLGLPWGGLVSRPRDLARFVDLFLPSACGRPRFEGVASTGSLVSRPTVHAMTSVQAKPPDAPLEMALPLRDGAPPPRRRAFVPWGLGWAINGIRHQFFGDLNAPSAYGHIGSMGTMAWGDPELDVVCVVLTNRGLSSGWTLQRPRQSLFSKAVVASAL